MFELTYIHKFIVAMGTLLLLFLSAPLWGAAQDQSVPPPDTLKPQIVALTVSQIPEYGKQTRQLLSSSANQVKQDVDLNEIATATTQTIELLDEKLSQLGDTTILYQTQRLDKETREIELINQRVKNWRANTENWIEIQTEFIEKTDTIYNTWELTLDSVNANISRLGTDSTTISNFNSIKTDIEGFISELNLSKQQFENQILILKSYLTQLAIAENKIGNVTDLIDKRRKKEKEKIWEADSPLIWKANPNTFSHNRNKEIITFVKSDWNIISVYFKNQSQLPFYTLVYFGLILLVIFYLKLHAKKYYGHLGDELKEAKILLENPIISAIIIAWLGSFLLIDSPKELNDLVSLLMLFPLCIILWRLNPHWKLSSLLIFSVSYLIFLLITYINYGFIGPRILLITVNILVIVILFVFYRKKAQIENLNKLFYGTLSFILKFFIFLSLLALVANVYGAIRLVQAIIVVVMGSIIAIQVLRAAVFLSRSLIFLTLMGPLTQYSHILQQDSKVILAKMFTIFQLIGFISFIVIFLDLLNISSNVYEAFLYLINTPVKVGKLNMSLNNILSFFLMIFIVTKLSEFIRYVLEKEVFPRLTLKRGVPNTISLMIKFTFVLLAIILAFAAAGIDMDKLAIAVGALGVGIGFGLQNIVNNFVSGIIIALERPFSIGDIVEIQDTSGTIKDIGIRSSTVRTWGGSDVIVPNGQLISNKLTNWTFFDRLRRITVEVRVPFDTEMETLSQLLLATAKKCPDVCKTPKPYLNLKGIGTSAMEVNLFCWIDDASMVFSKGTAIRKTIYKALQDAGYTIPVPIQDIKIEPLEKDTDITENIIKK